MRLFVAADPSQACLDRIEDLVSKLRARAPDVKWVRAEGRHLTLAFLGEVPDEDLDEVLEKTREVVQKHHCVTLRFEGGGCFGGRKPRVLWAGVKGEQAALSALQRLQDELTSTLAEFGAEAERSFTPHVTLARAKEARGDERLLLCAQMLEGEVFGAADISEIVVYRSELSPRGAKYTAMARLPLGPSLPVTTPGAETG